MKGLGFLVCLFIFVRVWGFFLFLRILPKIWQEKFDVLLDLFSEDAFFDHILDCISMIQMIKKMEIPTTLFLSPEEADLIHAFSNSVKFQMLLIPVWTGQNWNSHCPVFTHSKIKLFSSNNSDVTLLLASKPSSAIKHLLLLLGMSLLTEKQQIFRLFFFFFFFITLLKL